MRTAKLLPKFGSGKNPFATIPKTEPLRPEPGATTGRMETDSLFEIEPKAALAPLRKTPARKEAKPAAPPEQKPEAGPADTVPRPAEPKAAKPGALAGLIKRLNPMSYLPKRKPAGARPRGSRTPVQGEFSLEKVRVMRNDLSDSDLEFINAKPAARTAGTMLPALPQPGLTAWGRLTSRTMGLVETQTQ